jgi:CIC family chloride channel protein
MRSVPWLRNRGAEPLSREIDMLTGRKQWIIIDTVLLGVVGALSAQLFTLMLKGAEALFLGGLAGYTPPGLPDEGGVLRQVIGAHGLWLIPLATTLGGLISGVLVYGLAPEAEGHGTDTAVKAFHRTAGFIRARVAPLKAVASAITIGSGGAAGREGPTALMSAGIGSIYATLAKRSEEDRRLLVLIGMAAGLAAIFRSPIGTAIFAIEVLYADMEFEAAALLYTMLASLVAYVINGVFVGWQPLFQVPQGVSAPEFTDYIWYALLGLGSGVVATLLPMVFYGLRDLFHKVPVPRHVKPAIGGLGVGLLALVLPQVLGGGYGWIQEAMDGRLTLMILLVLIFAKMVAFALTVSSGGSGGVFAPSLFVGAMVGGFMAELFHQPPAAYVIVGMAAVFGGAARVPIATLLMVTEMTGGYQLLVPAALAVTLSYLVQTVLSSPLKYRSLYEAQMVSRADSPAHDMENFCIALDLVCKPWVSEPNKVQHLDLMALLKSGVAVNLSEEKQLTIGLLRQESPWVGKTVRLGTTEEHEDGLEIIAILRAGQILLPRPDTRLQAGDRLLVITSPNAKDWLEKHLAPLPPQ